MMLRLTLRSLAAHRLRLLLTAVSVVLGVAFVAGTLIFTDTMDGQAGDIAGHLGRNVAVEVRAKDPGGRTKGVSVPVPESVLDGVRGVAGVREPVGVVTGYAALVGKDGTAVAAQGAQNPGSVSQTGGNWIPGGDHPLKTGRAPNGPAEMVVDEATAKRGGFRTGDEATVRFKGADRPMRIVGLVGSGDLAGRTLTLFDTPTAQRLLLRPGDFTAVRMASDGVSESVLRGRVAAVLPGRLEAITGTQLRTELRNDLATLSYVGGFLTAFALISVFVGAFVIFNTFSMLVAQRTRELALLRALGASNKQVSRAVLGEAFAVGVVGSTLGLAAGTGMAAFLQVILNGGATSAPAFSGTAVAASYVVGTTATVVSAYVPARRAARIPPIAALRDDVAPPQRALGRRVVTGTVLTALGGLAVLAGQLGAGLMAKALVGLGATLVFLGVTALSPVISGPVIELLGKGFPRWFGTPGLLARRNAQRSPRRTAATAGALMVGLALVGTVNVLGASMKASVSRQIESSFVDDYFVLPVRGSSIDADAIRRAASTPGIERTTPTYTGTVDLNGSRLEYSAGDLPTIMAPVAHRMAAGDLNAGTDGVLVESDVASAHHWKVGTILSARFPDGGGQDVRVAGIYPLVGLGNVMLPESLYKAHTPLPAAHSLSLKVRTADAATLRALRRSLAGYPDLGIYDRSGWKKEKVQSLDQMTTQITLLLALSVVIAAIGVANTLALSVFERTRELGLLRAVGVDRGQLRRMIRLESILIALFGAVLGLLIGLGFGIALQHAMAGLGFDVLVVPVVPLALCAVLAGVIGVAAAVWPARRAGRMDVLTAIAHE
ncbi:ABC transporter permease [Actinomadura oligospora]|uniref:ABC transporter permease n=1 Tax=Actinomadura oligospora TaxID=111804 RepID=UPI0004ADBEA8|nr:ABC transporter permease [Actinomadura oligospora]